MATTDLQRLFWRTATAVSSPREDFTSEVLRIAIRHDPRPLLRVLGALGDAGWKHESGRLPSLVDPVRAESETQTPLHAHAGIDSGRLDVVVDLEDAAGVARTLWIEVKIDAPLTSHEVGDQLDVYMAHRRERPAPQPVLITLGKAAPLEPS